MPHLVHDDAFEGPSVLHPDNIADVKVHASSVADARAGEPGGVGASRTENAGGTIDVRQSGGD